MFAGSIEGGAPVGDHRDAVGEEDAIEPAIELHGRRVGLDACDVRPVALTHAMSSALEHGFGEIETDEFAAARGIEMFRHQREVEARTAADFEDVVVRLELHRADGGLAAMEEGPSRKVVDGGVEAVEALDRVFGSLIHSRRLPRAIVAPPGLKPWATRPTGEGRSNGCRLVLRAVSGRCPDLLFEVDAVVFVGFDG